MDEVKQNDMEQQEEIRKPNQSSVLFERYMGWFVLAILAGAIWFKNTPLIVVSSFLLTISLTISVWKRKALQGLTPAIYLPKSRVFAGDQVPLVCTLNNDKWLPLVWVEWELPQQEGLNWNEEKGSYFIRLLWLLGYRQVTWEIEGSAIQRGVYSVGQVLLRSGDAFRFAETESQVDLKKHVYVYPRLLPVQVPLLLNVFQWGISGKKGGMLEDPSHISGIREYQSGDEWRKIHWQASARTGSLKTWVYQPVVPRQLIIGIDAAGFANTDNDAFEWFLSVIASLGIAYFRKGIRLGHASNALDHRGKKIRSKPCSPSITALMDDLAKMASQIDQSQDSLWEELVPKGRVIAPVYYFCQRIEEKHVLWAKLNKKAAPYVLFYYRQPTSFAYLLQGQAKSMETLHMDNGGTK